MGYQVTGAEASITSWTSTEGAFLLATGSAPHKFSFTFQTDALDITSQSDSARKFRAGLGQWSGSITAYFPKTARKIGASGLVTFASGEVTHVNEWNLNADWGALDITEMTGANVLWRAFRPMKLAKISGGFSGYVDSAVSPIMPVTWASSTAAATLKISEEGATDNQITGNILAHDLGIDADMGQDSLTTKKYSFTFDDAATIVGATNFLPAGALAVPQWDSNSDGTPDTTLTLTLASGRTIAGPAYLKGFSINVKMAELIEVVYNVQGAGAVTVV